MARSAEEAKRSTLTIRLIVNKKGPQRRSPFLFLNTYSLQSDVNLLVHHPSSVLPHNASPNLFHICNHS